MQKECSRILQEVEKVIKGKEQEKKLILRQYWPKGHILLDDIPGSGEDNTYDGIFPCYAVRG